MPYIEKQKDHFYRVERIGGRKVRQPLSEYEAWAAEHQKGYDPNWRDNPPLEIDPRTELPKHPSLPCIRMEGAICRIRTIPGAPFDCLFNGGCAFRIEKGD